MWKKIPLLHSIMLSYCRSYQSDHTLFSQLCYLEVHFLISVTMQSWNVSKYSFISEIGYTVWISSELWQNGFTLDSPLCILSTHSGRNTSYVRRGKTTLKGASIDQNALPPTRHLSKIHGLVCDRQLSCWCLGCSFQLNIKSAGQLS